MITSKRPDERGLTLTELVLACFVLVVLTGLVWTTFRYDTQSFSRQTSQNATQSTLRIWAARMERDMLRACFNPTEATPGPFKIVSATSTDFHFNLDYGSTGSLDGASAQSNLGYRLSGTNLELWQSGSSWRVVLLGVTGLSFNYYNLQGSQVNQTSPYTSTQDISEVEATLTAQATTGGYAGSTAPTITEHFRVFLRNQC